MIQSNININIRGKDVLLMEHHVTAALEIVKCDGATYHGDDWYSDIPIQKGEVVKMFCKRGESKSKNLNSCGKLVHNMTESKYAT